MKRQNKKNIIISLSMFLVMNLIYVIQFYFYYVHGLILESTKHAHFSITANSIYIPQSQSSFLVNITDMTVTTIEDCSVKCLNHERCQTVIYYHETLVCSLFCEESSVGQMVNGTNQASSVMSMTNRQPTSRNIAVVFNIICFLFT